MLLLPLSFVIAAAVAAPAPALGPAAASLAAAEFAFADQSGKNGIPAAFLANIHPEAVVYIPRPVKAQNYYETQLELGAALNWFPVRVETSAAGDLGWSTGPFTWRAAKDAPASAFGWFISVWQREGSGPWKVRVDFGTTTPDPDAAEQPTQTPLPRTGGAAPDAGKGPALSTDLLKLDKDFGNDARRDINAAYASRVAANVRLYRERRFPLEGAATLKRFLDPWPVDFQPYEALVSGSGDLVVSRGVLVRTMPAKAGTPENKAGTPESRTKSEYMHIWQKAGGDFKLVLEVEGAAK